jgi:hypothetical protein
MRRMRVQEQEEAEARIREAAGCPGDEDGNSLKIEMERRGSSSSPRG